MRSYSTIKSKQTRINKLELNKNYKEIGVAIKSKETSSKLSIAEKLLATHSRGSIVYYFCLFMQTQFRLGSYIHAFTNETHSLENI